MVPCWVLHLINAGLSLGLWLVTWLYTYVVRHHSEAPTWNRSLIANKPELADYSAELLPAGTLWHPQWLVLMRVAAFPSLFASLLYLVFTPMSQHGGTHQDFSQHAFNSCIDCVSQGAFSALLFGHFVVFGLSVSIFSNQQRVRVVDRLRLDGSESVVSVMCGRGWWSNEIARRLDRGHCWCVDSWGSANTPYDQQWIIFNSVCEGTADRIDACGSWDLHHLPFADNEHDVIFSSWLPWYDEVGAERVIHEMVRWPSYPPTGAVHQAWWQVGDRAADAVDQCR